MKDLANLAVRIEVTEEAIRHQLIKHLVMTEAEVSALIKAAVERIDIKAELEAAVQRLVRDMVRQRIESTARRKAQEMIERVMGEIEEGT